MMKKAAKLKLCNWSLLISAILILASAIQLEAIHSGNRFWVWIHVAIGMVFSALVYIHIHLHFGSSNWFARFSKLKSVVTRILWWLMLLTVASGVTAFVHWLISQEHSPICGVHGKIGFLMILIAAGHTLKRFKFFRRK